MTKAEQERYVRRTDEAHGDAHEMDVAQGEYFTSIIAAVQIEVIRLREAGITREATITRLKATLDEHLKEQAEGAPTPTALEPHARERRVLDLTTAAAMMIQSILVELQDLNSHDIMRFEDVHLKKVEDTYLRMREIAQDLQARMAATEHKVEALEAEAAAPPPGPDAPA